ncbi:MAG: DUF1664 domain-containing protein [Deltaproteobacteria bacterium]|jgi:hypothetical protein|nr:DUF1664 domain-containing protein [Deltaproteobacteria bacterium]
MSVQNKEIPEGPRSRNEPPAPTPLAEGERTPDELLSLAAAQEGQRNSGAPFPQPQANYAHLEMDLAVRVGKLESEIQAARMEFKTRIDRVDSKIEIGLSGVRSEMSGLRDGLKGDMRGLKDGLEGKLDGLKGELTGFKNILKAELNGFKEGLEAKLDGLNAQTSHVWAAVAIIATIAIILGTMLFTGYGKANYRESLDTRQVLMAPAPLYQETPPDRLDPGAHAETSSQSAP